MSAGRPLLLAILAAFGLAGCRTAGSGSIAHNRPPEVQPRPAFRLDDFVAEHNRNAERIQSLEARPSIAVTMGPPGEVVNGSVDGKLALERPRYFKLELASKMSNLANIGSNDERFWFWFQNKKDKSVYVCDYAELETTSLAVTYQPDWIAEALGFKLITPDEAARIRARPGPQPGTTALTFPPTRSGGQTYSRTMLVSDLTGRMIEFRVLGPDGKTPIAGATVKKYHDYPVGEAGDSDSNSAAAATCYFPENIVLEWKRELLSLDVVLPPRSVVVNKFDPARRAALFVEPKPPGYARVNLAEVARQQDTARSTAVRETMPIPAPRQRVRLAPPVQIEGGEPAASSKPPTRDPIASRKAPTRSQEQPQGILLPVIDLDVVGAPVPTVADPALTHGMASMPAPSLER